MRIYISVDMEGVAGIVHSDQTSRTGKDYEKARHLMTEEANAAIKGAVVLARKKLLSMIRMVRCEISKPTNLWKKLI
jgi:D-amino peptidase